MSVKICGVVLLICMLPLLGGCVARTAVVSQDGQAFVSSGNIFGTSMYYCDAKTGRPECWPVQEQLLPEGGK